MTRIAKLMGGTRMAWGAALVLTSVHFGMIHFYQGVSGMVATGVMGFLYGAAYLVFRRKLWVTVVAHALSHVVSFTLLYLGAVWISRARARREPLHAQSVGRRDRLRTIARHRKGST
jgi:hypothetical protein